jgi:hypothetical protein
MAPVVGCCSQLKSLSLCSCAFSVQELPVTLAGTTALTEFYGRHTHNVHLLSFLRAGSLPHSLIKLTLLDFMPPVAISELEMYTHCGRCRIFISDCLNAICISRHRLSLIRSPNSCQHCRSLRGIVDHQRVCLSRFALVVMPLHNKMSQIAISG